MFVFSVYCSRSCTELLVSGSSFDPPVYGNVDYRDGRLVNYWVDSLSASLPALQVRTGLYSGWSKNGLDINLV